MLVAKLLGELLWIGARKDVDHAFLAIWQLNGHLEDDAAAWFGGGGWSVHIFGGESKGAVFVGAQIRRDQKLWGVVMGT